MGVGSLVAPLVAQRLLSPITPGKGRFGKALVATAFGAVAVTTAADLVARRFVDDEPEADVADSGPVDANRKARRARIGRVARKVASVGGVASIVTGGVAIASAWAAATSSARFRGWGKRRDLGTGPAGWAAAIFGWDFIYYWNHRLMHTSRYMWAVHVVHHSSERYNLSTALRQPVADALGTFVPYSLLVFAGVRPELILQARGINLIYQYWIHTDTIGKLGPFERIFNTASHHRVHHGSNPQYLDRNHGSILIIWDKLFGTFEPEEEPVVYGLTKNINTFAPGRIVTHEYADIVRDIADSETWSDRLSYVVRGPGWAYARHAERDALAMAN
jgi:sterol desaturase/sphingolipid hydroxylase (fatty acid hydroxylase superfamily)